MNSKSASNTATGGEGERCVQDRTGKSCPLHLGESPGSKNQESPSSCCSEPSSTAEELELKPLASLHALAVRPCSRVRPPAKSRYAPRRAHTAHTAWQTQPSLASPYFAVPVRSSGRFNQRLHLTEQARRAPLSRHASQKRRQPQRPRARPWASKQAVARVLAADGR